MCKLNFIFLLVFNYSPQYLRKKKNHWPYAILVKSNLSSFGKSLATPEGLLFSHFHKYN